MINIPTLYLFGSIILLGEMFLASGVLQELAYNKIEHNDVKKRSIDLFILPVYLLLVKIDTLIFN